MTTPLVTRETDIETAAHAAQCVVETHLRLADWLRCGQTLAQIDTFIAEQLADLSCKSCFLGYKAGGSPAFPSHACLSPNACIVHGTAGFTTEPMRPGDLLSIDIGVTYHGWIGDAAWTYAFEEASDAALRLMRCGRESIALGVAQLRPENCYIDFARAVQECVEGEYGYHCVRGLGGHGIGRKLHQPPFVANNVPTHQSEWPDAYTRCMPGTLLAVEPMIAIGTAQISQRGKEWPIFTADGSLSVHYEHDVLITEGDPRVLTAGLTELPDIVG